MAERVEDTVKQLLVERLFLQQKPDDISDDTLLMEELGVDSVSVFEVVVGLEEVYGIQFGDDEFEIETFRTPRSIAEYVREKLAAGGANDPG